MFIIATTWALHSSTNHSPFQVGLGFQPLGPIDVALPLATTKIESSHVQSKVKKPLDSLRIFNTSTNRSMRFCRKSMLSTSNSMINTGTTQVSGGRQGLVTFVERSLTGPHQKLCPLFYGPYTITKVVGDNDFELNTPPFLGLHPVFNVDLLWPYFPPLLDTSEITEQLTPI
jgi:hypothetical protein